VQTEAWEAAKRCVRAYARVVAEQRGGQSIREAKRGGLPRRSDAMSSSQHSTRASETLV
jgi:hypothetical protein